MVLSDEMFNLWSLLDHKTQRDDFSYFNEYSNFLLEEKFQITNH